MRLVLIAVLIAIFFAVANAITCYQCDSLNDPRCNEFFCPNEKMEKNCDEADLPSYLKKYVSRLPATGCITKIHEGVGGHRFFIRRSCYFGDVDHTSEACEAEDEYVSFAKKVACHVCVDDLCNTDAGRKLKSSKGILILMIFICFGLYKVLGV